MRPQRLPVAATRTTAPTQTNTPTVTAPSSQRELRSRLAISATRTARCPCDHAKCAPLTGNRRQRSGGTRRLSPARRPWIGSLANRRRVLSAVTLERSRRWEACRDEAKKARWADCVSPARLGEVEESEARDHTAAASRPTSMGRAVRGEGATPRPALAWWSRPRNSSPKSTPSEGNRIRAPATTATITATSVSCGAAACSTVKPGSRTGFWASAHPATTAATAPAAPTRAASKRRVHTGPSVPAPATTEATSAGPSAPLHETVVQRVRVMVDDDQPDHRQCSSTNPQPSARARKRRSSSSSPCRRASALRYTAAKYAPEATASTPTKIEVGLSQLENRWPAAFPRGTRREAMPPTAAPSANGVRTDEMPNSVSIARCSRPEDAPARRTYVTPRNMIPAVAMNSAKLRVDAIEPHAAGYAVQTTV